MNYLGITFGLLALGFKLVWVFRHIGTRTALVLVLILLDLLALASVLPYFAGARAGLVVTGIGLGLMLLLVFLFVITWQKDTAEEKGWIHRKKMTK